MKNRLLITGSNGFLGKNLVRCLSENNKFYTSNVQRLKQSSEDNLEHTFYIKQLDGNTDWRSALRNQDVVIHTAAMVHKPKASKIPFERSKYKTINVDGTLNLARQAAEAGVKRFIFISSIGVNGQISTQPFSETDEPNPTDIYSYSKLQAEIGLWKIQRETEIDIVILRPPLIYGPNAPGNFGSLVRLIQYGLPLPFGSFDSQRTLIGIDNILELINLCITNPAAKNQLFVCGDNESVSTKELIYKISSILNRRIHLFSLPSAKLVSAAKFFGKETSVKRMSYPMLIDSSKAKNILSWKVSSSLNDGLSKCF
ncbi:NAD-dependent epimerase/dehydratase family protein [Amylibacter sp.]|nr:NAD-dependent epimerase/dehydratase family protein [Amylibacter sp.]